MFSTLLAAGDPVGAVLSSNTFRNVATFVLVGVAVLAVFYPAMLAKIKATFSNWVDERLHSAIPATTAPVIPGVDPVSLKAAPPAVNIGALAQQRAASLKEACPRAAPELRLKWLEEGFDTPTAQADYINILERQLTAATAAASQAIPTGPATPVPVPPV